MTKNGQLFIFSAPSGAGKTTLRKAICKQFPDMVFSISYTTRKPRKNERYGVDYFFITEDEFNKGIEDKKWAEWAKVHGNYYGTPSDFIENTLSSGKNILCDIDVNGAKQLLKLFPKSITIFIMPPSIEVLRKRLETRDTDSKKIIEKRLYNAKKEISQNQFYKYIVVNDKLDIATNELIDIIINQTGKKKL